MNGPQLSPVWVPQETARLLNWREGPDRIEVEHPEPGSRASKAARPGLGFISVLGAGVDYDVDHFVLRVMTPDETALALAELGFGAERRRPPRRRHARPPASGNQVGRGQRAAGHVGVLVESVEALKGQALRAGLELTLAPNWVGMYVRGPERLRGEYAEPR